MAYLNPVLNNPLGSVRFQRWVKLSDSNDGRFIIFFWFGVFFTIANKRFISNHNEQLGATYIIREDAMFDADLVAFVAGYQPEFPTLRFNISSTNKQPNINRMLCIHKRQCLSVECTTRFLIGRNTSEWQGFFGLPTELTHTDFYSNRKTMNVA